MSETNEWVVDVGIEGFEREVVERSKSVPVVVDFWAPWCDPCRELGPKLERAARAGNGRFLLAKVDIDQNPELAQMFRIQGIPAVLAIVGGRIADGFQGLVDDAALEDFLRSVAPSAPQADELLEAESLVAQGQADGAVALLRERLAENPDHAKTRTYLAGVLADEGRWAEAREALDGLSEADRLAPEARAILSKIELGEKAGDRAELEAKVAADPGDFAARIELGKTLVAVGSTETGLERLLEVVSEPDAPKKVRDEARRGMLEAFEVLGLEDPLANAYRFKLSMVVFA